MKKKKQLPHRRTPELRDQFAIAALPTIYGAYQYSNGHQEQIAQLAYIMADEMLKARKV
jgi:hypothetical protein